MITGIISVSAYSVAVEYDASGNPIYVGEAKPGTPKDSQGWRIKFITFDPMNNPTDVQWAKGNINFDKIWDDRKTYIYS
jgi:hypothetical protein